MGSSSTTVAPPPRNRGQSNAFRIVSGLALFDVVLIVLSFTPWFSGTAQEPGCADKLFGHLRFGGFRADFFWLLLSNILLFALLFACIAGRKNRSARVAANFTLVELTAFLVFIIHSLTSGLLYMG